MSLIEQIKADCLIARKARATVKASSLITFIGEAERIGKDAGNRAPTDAEVTSLLQKFVKNLGEVRKVRPDDQAAAVEQALLEGYLPSRLTGVALRQAVETAVQAAGLDSVTGKDIGTVMKALAVAHPNAYDGAEASALIRSLASK